MSDDTNFLLELSTAVVETEKFTVDGEEYELLGLNHLTEADEVAVMAMFARYEKLAEMLAEAPNQKKGEDLAKAMRILRLKLLAKMTTCPQAIIAKLPLKGQITLMEAIGEEFENDDDEKEDAPEA